MNTRSKGNQNIHPFTDEIDQLQRTIRNQRRHFNAEQMANNNQDIRQNLPLGADPHNPVDHRPPPVVPPPAQANLYHRRGRQIGAGDTPHTHQTRFGIVPPPFENNNFDLKSSIIQTVENHQYNGLELENPIGHLDLFEQYSDAFKQNGVSENAFKLRLFPFSLAGKAKQWLKQLAPGSITTWAQCKAAFLAKFYPPERTARMRNNIANFYQRNNEDFANALERFKTAIDDCPHHGFTDETLLSTLYRGVLPSVRKFLDGASNGSFLSKDVETGWELIENTAASSGIDGEEYDRCPEV